MLALDISCLVVLDVGTLETSSLLVLGVRTLETSHLVSDVGTLETSHPPSLDTNLLSVSFCFCVQLGQNSALVTLLNGYNFFIFLLGAPVQVPNGDWRSIMPIFR
jgi:hypothetical protein